MNQIFAFYAFIAILLAPGLRKEFPPHVEPQVTILLFLPHRVIMPCLIYFNFLQGRWLVDWRPLSRSAPCPLAYEHVDLRSLSVIIYYEMDTSYIKK